MLTKGTLFGLVMVMFGCVISPLAHGDTPSPPAPDPAPRPQEDDPGIKKAITDVLLLADTVSTVSPPTFRTAQVQTLFRRFEFICTESPCWYEHLSLMLYPSAWSDLKGWWKLLRYGIGLGGTWEHSQKRTRSWQQNFGAELILLAGLHYPARLTPFLQMVTGLGVFHRNVYNKDFIEFYYSLGLDVGVDFFMYNAWHISASIGWRRSAVDVKTGYQFIDSFTFQIAMGL